MSEMVSLTMKPLRFYSQLDEGSLVRNLESIKPVKDIRYIDSGITISVDREECDWESFKDIMSLFLRYDIDLRSLIDLAPNEEVKAWFISPARDWHSRLDGAQSGSSL